MQEQWDELHELMAKHDLLSLFEKLTLRERVAKVRRGIKAPKESGEHKYAMLELQRLSAPISAIIVPLLVVGALTVFAKITPPPPRSVEVQIVEPEALDDLEDIEEIMEEPIEPPEPIDLEDFTPDIVIDQPNDLPPAPQTELNPVSAPIDSVAIVKSPVIMKGIFGSRNPGGRNRAMREYGGRVGASGVTEGAVLRALRWLKKIQHEDGSWTIAPLGAGEEKSAHPQAMTGLGLLTFLAHGETPESEEFGATVEKAIRYLLQSQAPGGNWASSYTHAIAAYAMCEAFALTRIPQVGEAAQRGLDVVIRGQNASGGWNYPLRPDERDDTSVMGWCAQALKAGKMAGMRNEGLDQCIKQAIEGFNKNADPKGGFGYATKGGERGPSATGLSGVGVLCMQLLGYSRRPECRKGLMFLEDHFLFNWSDGAKWNQIYYWYYITQAKFHEGGKTWSEWNQAFALPLVKAQVVLKGQGIDGKDIGYWVGADSRGAVMDTTLCALQLQVYYRYLPTYKTPSDIETEDVFAAEDDDIEIEITL